MSNIMRMLNAERSKFDRMSHEEFVGTCLPLKFDDLKSLTTQTPATKVESTIAKYGSIMSKTVAEMQEMNACEDSLASQLARICDMMTQACFIFGHTWLGTHT